MGNERRQAGKHLYLCAALLMALASCAHGPSRAPRAEGLQEHVQSGAGRWEHLQPVRANIASRDFEGAMRQYQRLLGSPAGPHYADLVLFDVALLHMHPANPGRDYQKALAGFNRLLKEQPRSPLADEARIWADVLETLERTKRVDLELEQRKKSLTN